MTRLSSLIVLSAAAIALASPALAKISVQGAESLTVTLPTNKGVIASRLNLTQEHFSRILHELSENGLIAVKGRRITIPNVEKLRGYDL